MVGVYKLGSRPSRGKQGKRGCVRKQGGDLLRQIILQKNARDANAKPGPNPSRKKTKGEDKTGWCSEGGRIRELKHHQRNEKPGEYSSKTRRLGRDRKEKHKKEGKKI